MNDFLSSRIFRQDDGIVYFIKFETISYSLYVSIDHFVRGPFYFYPYPGSQNSKYIHKETDFCQANSPFLSGTIYRLLQSELRSSIRKLHSALIACINAFSVEIRTMNYHYNNLLRSYRKKVARITYKPFYR